MQLGELLAHHPQTIVGRQVIDDPALYLRSCGFCQDGGRQFSKNRVMFQVKMMAETMLEISDMIYPTTWR
jgi:hypothetical protein